MNTTISTRPDITTLVSYISDARKDGFGEDFQVRGTQLVTETGRSYRPYEVRINNLYRYEGKTDPSDNAVLYLISTTGGEKGILPDAYGTYPDPELTSFITAVEGIGKDTKAPPLLKKLRPVPFSIAMLSLLFFFLSLLVHQPGVLFEPVLSGMAVLFAGMYTGFVILEVLNGQHLRTYQRRLWLCLTVSIPFIGAMVYHMLHQDKNKIAG